MIFAYRRRVEHDARLLTLTALAVASLVLTGCGKEPGGQVVAVVGNDEITQQDVRAQAVAENITEKAALDAATPAIVRRLVDRTVLSNYAREIKLDRGPEYVARRRQMEETMLAYLALRKLLGEMKPPGQPDIEAFIVANPMMFEQRTRLSLDQIRVATPADPTTVTRLSQLGSLEAVAARLQAQRIRFVKTTAFFDTGTVDSKLATRVSELNDGAVFDLTMGGTSYISQIRSRSPVPGTKAAWQAQALSVMQNKMVSDAAASKLGNLKSKTAIKYDPAYKPKGQ